MPLYPALSILALVVVLVFERTTVRSGIFRDPTFWIAMTIVYAFMIPTDGWLTKLSAPIVIYDPDVTSGWRPVWDIPAEEFVYAFALLALTIMLWERAGAEQAAR
jgi:lycopene cyclase domain-containing protein